MGDCGQGASLPHESGLLAILKISFSCVGAKVSLSGIILDHGSEDKISASGGGGHGSEVGKISAEHDDDGDCVRD